MKDPESIWYLQRTPNPEYHITHMLLIDAAVLPSQSSCRPPALQRGPPLRHYQHLDMTHLREEAEEEEASMDVMAEEQRVKRTLTEEAKERKGE
ncbi:hypothetical protein GBF38_003557, partial [Nibea albiflora]